MIRKTFIRLAAAAVALLLLLQVAPSNRALADSPSAGQSAKPAAATAAEEADSPAAYEAEAPVNTLGGKASVVDCQPQTGCSGGRKVGNLWSNSSLQFNGIQVSTEGVYTVTMDYISGDPRPVTVSVNGGEKETFNPPKTADWDTLGSFSFEVRLSAGDNTITFSDEGGWSPDIDKIEIVRSADDDDNLGDGNIGHLGRKTKSVKIGSIAVTQYERGATFSNGLYTVTYNTESGLAAYDWGKKRVVTGVFSSIGLDRTIHSTDYAERRIDLNRIERISDTHGQGIEVTIENRQAGLPTMKQIYRLYKDKAYFLTRQEVSGDAPISTNYMAPVVAAAKGAVDLGSYDDNRVLVAPFDNDAWSRYQARTINTNLNTGQYISSEFTAVYDNAGRNGLIIGSVAHDTWKTGIAWSGSNDRLNRLTVFGGFTSASSTHDTQPHGKVIGTAVRSPEIFVGYYADYRDGLEGYGMANATEAPPLDFKRGVPAEVPVGWNSWGAYGSSLSYDKIVDVSDFFREKLQDSFHNKGNVYINLDSYWDNLTDEQLREAVATIHRNKQKAGIYYSPFAYWGTDMDQVVEGTGGRYTYGDLVLRDDAGQILPQLDGAYPLDPTHPGTKQRIAHYFNRFLEYGFEYIKIDFLSHGSLEGKHYDAAVTTGIQAYNEGMAYVNEVLDGRMFVSASIAPLFPSQYAHARRISCDVDGSLASTEYQLNNLTYGWWQNGTIYRFTDPDYMTLAKGGSEAAAATRVNAAAISGTVYLNSDDVRDPVAGQLMVSLLTNPRVNAVALKGKAFRPVEGNTGAQAADTFVLHDKKGEYYVAVFNYTQSGVSKTVDLQRAGLTDAARYTATDLWTGARTTVGGEWTVELGPAQSAIFKLTANK
ncbi:carbohydrate-binding protein [Paenibacillus sp. 32O-W]|uniref:carbohydrate-binding protein n=1 Tax=Paenibacillus sp. 32O-W TaxID=1695218 RepID=UPI00071FFB6E|nr:carbohydrate-binding protein [Paenibacillus sp. 32O-W]ALS26483.1 carbohydrate-binding protein [Paenibacillus sp. 32O-W]